ncbi:MAG TPA: hypothetical protein VMK13_02735 [Streptosporangiaceae bacterium]|nr:hypothetical protein [Streptosporangiaceae bacterium]
MRILQRRPGGQGPGGSAGTGTAAGLGGTTTDRWIGMWSARALCAFGAAYAVTMVAGFAAMGNLSKPLEDPYLAIMEVLILVMAPVLVLLAVVIHACAPEGTKTYSMTALGWILLAAGFTMTVHLVQLTVVRRIDPSAIHGFQYLFNWHWPSMLYGVDIVAWDIFFGLALLFAAPVFHAAGHAAARNGLLIAGAMCLVGVIGPAVNHIALRQIGIIGYAIVWPIVCIPLSKAFWHAGPPSGATVPAPGKDAEHALQTADQERLHRAS